MAGEQHRREYRVGSAEARGSTRRRELKRLGKRGGYRLGQLRLQGAAPAGSPLPYRPRFGPPRRGPVALWLLGAAVGTAVVAAGAVAGGWAVPFVAGLAAGPVSLAGRLRARATAVGVAVMGAGGWGIALAWPALTWGARAARGLEHGARTLPRLTGRATAPVLVVHEGAASYAVGVALALLAAAGLAVAGLWLGRVLSVRLMAGRPTFIHESD